MSSIGIVVSSPLEAQAFGVKAYSWHPVSIAENIWLSCCGQHNLALSLKTLHHLGVQGLLSWGFAGGLDPHLPTGTLIAPRQLVSSTGPTLEVSPSWHAHLMIHLNDQSILDCSPLTHSPKVLKKISEKQNYYLRTNASSVDLESYPIGLFAHQHQLDFLVLRVILDDAHTHLPHSIDSLQTPEGQLKLKALVHALTKIEHWPAYLTLGHQYHKAQSHLKKFVSNHSSDLFSFFG